jgi:hypothetical protein
MNWLLSETKSEDSKNRWYRRMQLRPATWATYFALRNRRGLI